MDRREMFTYLEKISKLDYYKLNYQGCAELTNMYKKEDDK